MDMEVRLCRRPELCNRSMGDFVMYMEVKE